MGLGAPAPGHAWKPLLIGTIGVAGILAGLAAPIAWPAPPTSTIAFQTWYGQADEQGVVAERANQTYVFPLARTNATQARLDWGFQDDIGHERASGDQIRVTLQGPEPHLRASLTRVANVTAPVAAHMVFRLAQAPQNITVERHRFADALAEARASGSTLGRGDWTVLVELLSADDAGPGLGSCDANQAALGLCRLDVSNSFWLRFSYQGYELPGA